MPEAGALVPNILGVPASGTSVPASGTSGIGALFAPFGRFDAESVQTTYVSTGAKAINPCAR